MASDVELRKVYIRHRENYPETEMMAQALVGFTTLGIEVAPFYWVDDLLRLEDLGPEVGIVGYLGDVHAGLLKLGRPIPDPDDYPSPLQPFLGRRVWRGTLSDVRASIDPIFVKPLEHKAFTGFCWGGQADAASRRRIVTHDDDTPVWLSEPVEMVAEYRCMVLYRQIIGCRLYKGDWSKAPNRETVEAAVAAMGKKAPKAYLLDFAVLADGRTVLVEFNHAFSFGHYGLPPVSYARMLSARWYELAKP
jgi:hypothetical protein